MEPLLKARKTVGRFFEQSANVVCSESVTQAIVGKNGIERDLERVQHEIDGLGECDPETRHALVGDRDTPTAFELLAKHWNDRAA